MRTNRHNSNTKYLRIIYVTRPRFRQMEIVSKGERTKQLGSEAYFIRAPAVLECGPAVATLARTTSAAEGVAVAVEQRPHILGTAFHPEISADNSWLR